MLIGCVVILRYAAEMSSYEFKSTATNNNRFCVRLLNSGEKATLFNEKLNLSKPRLTQNFTAISQRKITTAQFTLNRIEENARPYSE